MKPANLNNFRLNKIEIAEAKKVLTDHIKLEIDEINLFFIKDELLFNTKVIDFYLFN